MVCNHAVKSGDDVNVLSSMVIHFSSAGPRSLRSILTVSPVQVLSVWATIMTVLTIHIIYSHIAERSDKFVVS
jgi:hypothetical protein